MTVQPTYLQVKNSTPSFTVHFFCLAVAYIGLPFSHSFVISLPGRRPYGSEPFKDVCEAGYFVICDSRCSTIMLIRGI